MLAILRRILTSSVVALFLLPRLDCPLVIGGLEFLDKGSPHVILIMNCVICSLLSSSLGYTTYLAYIQVEAAYTNPVLNVFIHLLMTQNEVKLPKKTTHPSRKDI